MSDRGTYLVVRGTRWFPMRFRQARLRGHDPQPRLFAAVTQGGQWRGIYVKYRGMWHGFALLHSAVG